MNTSFKTYVFFSFQLVMLVLQIVYQFKIKNTFKITLKKYPIIIFSLATYHLNRLVCFFLLSRLIAKKPVCMEEEVEKIVVQYCLHCFVEEF